MEVCAAIERGRRTLRAKRAHCDIRVRMKSIQSSTQRRACIDATDGWCRCRSEMLHDIDELTACIDGSLYIRAVHFQTVDLLCHTNVADAVRAARKTICAQQT